MANDDNRPLLSMQPHERKRVLRKLGASINASILAEKFVTKLITVRRADGSPVIVFLEHGDGEGEESAIEFVQDCVAERLVKLGELRIDIGGDVLR